MASGVNFIVHDSTGLQIRGGSPNFGSESATFPPFEGKVKCFVSSGNGKRLAWIANGEVCVVESPEWKRIGTLQHLRAQEIVFSPQGNYLAIWDIYAKVEGAAAIPNLSVYDVTNRKLLKAFFQQSQSNWQPQWTKDESIFARSVTNEVHFYQSDDLQTVKNKKILSKVRSFSLSPSLNNHYTIFFVPSVKGAPAFVHLYKYPNFGDNSPALAHKSFYKVDSIETFWNGPCTAALLLTSGESGSTYYGEQMLFYLGARGDSARVSFAKTGSIRSVVWCPDGREFLAVYGTTPARATLFNHKCDPVAEFGEGARNIVLLNPLGTVLLLGALGNISSRFEMWDLKQRKLLGKQDCPDITQMEWSPCGKYLLTSTCCPRLRVNNGYRIWHYSAILVHEKLYAEGTELYDATWVPNPDAAEPFDLAASPVKGIQSEVKKASKERYVPPSQRAAMASKGTMVDNLTKFLSQREEDPEVAKKFEQQKKKKEENAKKKEEKKKLKKNKEGIDDNWREGELRKKFEEDKLRKEERIKSGGGNKNKRIKNIKKKLESIQELKNAEETGKTLNKSEQQKVSGEEALLQEMQQLELEKEREVVASGAAPTTTQDT